MRRTLFAAAVAAALAGLMPSTASASHSCAEGFEIICFVGCPAPPRICPWS